MSILLVPRKVISSTRPRYALATGTNSRKVFPVTVTDRSGKVRVISGEIVKPTRKNRKVRKPKAQKVSYRLSDQTITGDAVSFDLKVMQKIGSIHAD
jgi:hypothetical protein